MSTKKILAISVRDESFDDFLNIAKRVNRMDSTIGVVIRNGSFHPSEIPLQYLSLPLLTLYLVNPPTTPPVRGYSLCVKDLGKWEEYKNFVAAGVAVPKAQAYTIGDTVDPAEWGEYVILKPTNGSYGRGVMLLPTRALSSLTTAFIPESHSLLTSPYILQEFIDSGTHREEYRVLCFLGRELMAYKARNVQATRLPTSLEAGLSSTVYVVGTERERSLCFEPDVLAFARQAFDTHSDCPLQGLDIIRDAKTKKLYVLENNSGGNVWTFSRNASVVRAQFGTKILINQFKAWDRAAEILVEKTNELAR